MCLVSLKLTPKFEHVKYQFVQVVTDTQLYLLLLDLEDVALLDTWLVGSWQLFTVAVDVIARWVGYWCRSLACTQTHGAET